jgi:ABC-type nitrate/sulfonate/bicarbonate transport system substrate-binding protein
LFWYEEGQAIVTAPSADVHDAADLIGARIAVPALSARTPQLQRPVALHGFAGVLGRIGKTLDAVDVVEVPNGDQPLADFWSGTTAERPIPTLDALAAGAADAAYVVGPKAREYTTARGLTVALELDPLPGRQWRVNLGTPRALTVDQQTLDENPELVVDYLVRLLRASDWAAAHPAEFYDWFAAATGSSASTVRAIGSIEHPGSLRVQLTDELKHLYGLQKAFLVENGFIAGDFDLDAWADPAPLAEAYRRYQPGSEVPQA